MPDVRLVAIAVLIAFTGCDYGFLFPIKARDEVPMTTDGALLDMSDASAVDITFPPDDLADLSVAPDMTISCFPGSIYCKADSKCHDPLSDNNHCGKCGVKCEGGQVCVGGVCTCPELADGGIRSCSGKCMIVQNDPCNCGGCGIECANNDKTQFTYCLGATCVLFSCPQGTANCDLSPWNGCETRLTTQNLVCIGNSTWSCK